MVNLANKYFLPANGLAVVRRGDQLSKSPEPLTRPHEPLVKASNSQKALITAIGNILCFQESSFIGRQATE
jgi:hypothetical protein